MVIKVEKAPLVCSQRLTLAVMAFFGKFFVYSERVNLSVAILCMVRSDVTSNATSLGQDSYNSNNQTGLSEQETLSVDEQGEFDWDKSMQAQLLTMYFYGYVFTQILGGWLSSKFGGKRVWGICHLVGAICTLATPASARTHFYFACAVRFVLGLSAGVTFPAVHALLGRWAPPLERSKLVSYSFSGPLVGMVATLAVSGILCEYGFDNGWASIFYLCGIFNLIWVVVWFILTADGPEKHKRITERERDYIQNAIGKGAVKMNQRVPWVKMLTSRPVWAIIIAHIGSTYLTNTMLTSLPMFMKESLHFDIKQNGLLSALPYVTQFLAAIVFGYMADKFIEKRWLSVRNTRKLCQSISFLGAAAMFCIAVQLDASRRYVVVAILCIATAFTSANRGGYLSNHLDLAPSYAGILYGITNTCSNAVGITAPLVAGALTPNRTTEEWRSVFYVTAGICVFASIAFLTMADGELQEWAMVDGKLDIAIDIDTKCQKEDKEDNDTNNNAERNSLLVPGETDVTSDQGQSSSEY